MSNESATAPQLEERVLEVAGWLGEWVATRQGLPLGEIDPELPFACYGLDSVAALELTVDLETRFGVATPDTAAWSHPNIAELARWIAQSTAIAA